MRKALAIALAIALALCLPLVLQGQSVHIHSIDELNRSTAVDDHLKENRYRLEPDFRTRVNLGRSELGHPSLHYPRVKRLRDGSLIMFYQSSRIGVHCYCAYSKDGLVWEQGGRVFEAHPITNSGGEPDTRAYSTVDAVVLDNGDILAFVSFRAVKGYKRFPQDDGLAMKRSSDGGRTWSEEQVLYRTITWEPFAMQLPSGEVQVYFTDSDHDWKPASSGVTMLRSLDRGRSWTTHCQVIRQYRATAVRADGRAGSRKVWTDQMPSACLLGDGKTIMTVVESQDSTDHYKISLVKDGSNWATTLTGDMTGPSERKDNFMSGGGPYLAHFPSGETALSFQGKYFNVKLGLSDFNTIANARFVQPFPAHRSLWGSTEIFDHHTLIAAAPWLDEAKKNGTIEVCKMRLNHRVDAPYAHIRVDADNIEWAANTDALFLGSESQAQCCFRFAYDEGNLYILLECLDSEMLYRDKIRLVFSNGQNANGIFETFVRVGDEAVEADRSIDAEVYEEPGRGFLAEMSIPRDQLPFFKDRIFLFAQILKPNVTDGWSKVLEKEYSQWMPIRIMP